MNLVSGVQYHRCSAAPRTGNFSATRIRTPAAGIVENSSVEEFVRERVHKLGQKLGGGVQQIPGLPQFGR
jgi:hypothetical protein